MKLFDWSEQREAIRYAAAGGQALHTHRFGVSASSPAVFRSAVRGRNHIAHLFDWNAARLMATVEALGVTRLHIDRPDGAGQHCDLVGRPLVKALQLCSGKASAGRLWWRMNGRRPQLIASESEAARWNWVGPWPKSKYKDMLSRSQDRGVAWFRKRVGAADDRAMLPDDVFDLLLLSFTPDFTPLVDDHGIAGLMFYSCGRDRIEEAFERFATQSQVDAMLGQWRDPRCSINSPEAFAQRFESRFARPVGDRDLCMAFGRQAS